MAFRLPRVASIGWGGSFLNYLRKFLEKQPLGCNLSNVAAKGTTDVHAAIAGNTSVAEVTTGITNPAHPRNLRVTFAASWDGGNVTVVGTDEFDQVQTETFVAAAGTTVVGSKVFKTVTSVAHTAVGATTNTYSVGTGDKLGFGVKATGSFYVLTVDGVAEAGTLDTTNSGITPTSVPNGTRDYNILVLPE